MTTPRSLDYLLLRMCERWSMTLRELTCMSADQQQRLVAYEMVRERDEALGLRV